MREKAFENKIKAELERRGAWNIKYWGGAAYTKKGIPDILACYHRNFLGLEIKASDGLPSKLQIYNLRKIEKAEGLAGLLYPEDYDDFIRLLDDLDNDRTPMPNDYPFLTKWHNINKFRKE